MTRNNGNESFWGKSLNFIPPKNMEGMKTVITDLKISPSGEIIRISPSNSGGQSEPVGGFPKKIAKNP